MINSGKNKMKNERKTGWARKLFVGLMTIFSLALVVTAIVSAINLPPVVTISANPNPAQTTSVITAIAIDSSHNGIEWVKIYENGVEARHCNAAACAYSAVHTTPGTWSYNASAMDRTGRISNSPLIDVEFVDVPPILNPIGNFTVEVHELLEFEVSGFDFEERDELVFSASGLGPGFGMPPGAVFDADTRTFSWTPGSGQLGTWLVNFTVSDSYASDSEIVAITVIDTKAPQYSNLNAEPEPAVYEKDGDYVFSAVWTDNVGVESVWFEFDGAIYNNVVENGDVYSITFHDLRADDYEYRWFANDSSGNSNQTDIIPYVISRAPTTTSVVVNPSSPIRYGLESNFSCFNSGELDTILYVDGVDANSQAGLSIVRSAGTYTLSCNSTENENYTASSSGDVVYVIEKAVPVLESSVTSPINYTTASNYVANESNSGDDDLVYTLTRNGVPIAAGSSVADSEVLGAGEYVYNYSTAGGENYSAAERIDVLVVDKADPRFIGSPVLGITFSPSDNVAYGTETTVTGVGCPTQLTCELFRDGVSVTSPDVNTLAGGTYYYSYNTDGNENYTSVGVSVPLIVNKIAPDLHLFINDLEEDLNITYGEITNASAFSSTSEVELYRNGALVADEDAGVLGAGFYKYIAEAVENENYSFASVTRVINVNKSLSECFIESNSPQTYPNPINVSASCTNPEASLQLFRGELDVTGENGQNVVLDAGTWTYSVMVPETENYTGAENTLDVVVNRGNPVMTYSVNGGIDDLILTYNETVNATVGSDAGTVHIFRDGIDVTNENGEDIVLGVGSYTYEFNVTGDGNWNDVQSEFLNVYVNQGIAQVSLEFDKSSPQDYLNTIRATCSVVIGEGVPILYRNGVDVSNENGQDIVLGAGTWDYDCAMAATQNYSADSESFSFVIEPIEMPLHLYLDGVEADETVVYGTETTAEGTKDYDEGILELYRDSVSVANPETAVLGAGLYEYTLYFGATQNFTETSEIFYLDVTRADPTDPSNPSGTFLELSILPSDEVAWGTETIVTGSGCPTELICALYRDGVPVGNPETAVLLDGDYVYTYSTPGNDNYTAGSVSGNLRVIDLTAPLIWFEDETTESGEQTADSLTINASASDLHLEEIVIDVYDESGLYYSLTCPDNNCFVDINGLADGTYWFNASAADSSGNENSTETRMIVIDSTVPEVVGLSIVPNPIWMGQTIAINFNVSELNLYDVTAEITLPDGSFDYIIWEEPLGDVYDAIYWGTEQNGTYNVRIIATDRFGNVNDSENADFVVNYGVRSIINSNIYGAYYPNNYTSEVETTTVTDSTIIDSTISGIVVDITDSLINNSQLTDVSVINLCEVHNSVIVGGICDNVYIDPSNVQNSNTTGSTIIDSRVWNSNATYSLIDSSSLDYSNLDNSQMLNSNLTSSNLVDSSAENSVLENITAVNSVFINTSLGDELPISVDGATIINDTVYNGTFVYNNTLVNLSEIGPRTFRYLIDYTPIAVLQVSTTSTEVYTGDVVTFDASGSSDLNLNETTGESLALTFNENLTYTFYFGDGAIYSTNESVTTHGFAEAGTYSAYVVVTDAFGRESVSTLHTLSVLARARSGGGGGGSTSCITNWTCSEWSACANGTQTRICEKIKFNCYESEPKPAEEMSCSTQKNETKTGIITKIIEDVEETGSKITGAVTGAVGDSRMKLALIFIIAILIAGGILWLARRKNSEAKTRKSRRG